MNSETTIQSPGKRRPSFPSAFRRLQANIIPLLFISFLCALITIPMFHEAIRSAKSVRTPDYLAHINILIKAVGDGSWPAYPLYHVVVFLASFGSLDAVQLSRVSILVLSFCIYVKLLLSYFTLQESLQSKIKSSLISVALILAMPVMNWWGNHIYLGQIPPNTWHNPTTIAAMPFALALFLYAYRSADGLRLKDYAVLAALVILNLLAKPNYILAFLPVFFLAEFVLLLRGWSRERLWGLVIVATPTVVTLVLQYVLTFNSAGSISTGLVLAPLGVWSRYSHNIPASLVLSIAFPLYYLFLYFKDAKTDRRLRFAWAVFAVALVEFTLFAEAGDRFSHGNFIWGSIIGAFVLFLVTSAGFFKQKLSVKYWIGLAIFLLHLAAGALYYGQVVLGEGYA